MARSQELIKLLQNLITVNLQDNNSTIRFFLQHDFLGGWEGWLQVEYAKAVYQYLVQTGLNGYHTFNREVSFPNGGGRCDLWFEPGRGADMWVELKAQRNRSYRGTVIDFEADISKLVSQSQQFLEQNVSVAMAVLVLNKEYKKNLATFYFEAPEQGNLEYWAFRPDGDPLWVNVSSDVAMEADGTVMLLTYRPD